MDTKPLQLFYTHADEANQFPKRILPLIEEGQEELCRLCFQDLEVASRRRQRVAARFGFKIRKTHREYHGAKMREPFGRQSADHILAERPEPFAQKLRVSGILLERFLLPDGFGFIRFLDGRLVPAMDLLVQIHSPLSEQGMQLLLREPSHVLDDRDPHPGEFGLGLGPDTRNGSYRKGCEECGGVFFSHGG